MGWKTVKKHYGIEDTFAFYPGKGFCIGNQYVHDLIVVEPETRAVLIPGVYGPASLPAPFRAYWEAIQADLETFWSLMDAEDRFDASIPVYSAQDGKVLELYCEEYGWPNQTHDGRIIHENTIFLDRTAALRQGLEEAKMREQLHMEQYARLKSRLSDLETEIRNANDDVTYYVRQLYPST
jgi:hypothetical protein